MKNTTKNIIKVLGGVTTGVIVGGIGAYLLVPQDIQTVHDVIYKNITVEVPHEVIKEVPIDNGKLGEFEQFIYDNDGNINYITSDLKNNEVNQIADRIILVNEFKNLSIHEVNRSLFYKVDGDEIDGETLNIRDLTNLRINDDYDEISVDYIDFDYKDSIIKVTGEFEQFDIVYNFTANVEFKNDDFYDFKNVSVKKQ